MADRYISLSQAAELTKKITGQHIAEVSLRAAADRGALRARKQGDRWVTTERDLRAYLSGRPTHFREAVRSDVVPSSGSRDIKIRHKGKEKDGRLLKKSDSQ